MSWTGPSERYQRNIPLWPVCAVARKSPTGEKAREVTGDDTENQSMSMEPGTSQTRTVESMDAVTSKRASGLQAMS